MSSDMKRLVQDWAEARGYRHAWGSPDTVESVRREIARRREEGEFNRFFYDTAIATSFAYSPVEPLERFSSVLVVVVPRPVHLLRFQTPDGLLEAVVPPTYVNYREVSRRIRNELSATVGPSNHISRLSVPHKLLAAKAGLVRYGRNNITYTPEFGSYQQIVALATDIEAGHLPEAEPSMMDACEDCRACRRACPTGAIGDERFLLHAERCLTFLNEYPPDWPEWVPPDAHNAIEGCMECQKCCPANKGKLRFELLPETVTSEETAAVLNGASGPARDGVRVKLESFDLQGLDDVLERNLRALLQARRKR